VSGSFAAFRSKSSLSEYDAIAEIRRTPDNTPYEPIRFHHILTWSDARARTCMVSFLCVRTAGRKTEQPAHWLRGPNHGFPDRRKHTRLCCMQRPNGIRMPSRRH